MRARLALLLAAAVVAGGCGSGAKVDVPSPADARHALAGSPAPLAALHRQASELLGGGQQAFTARLASLRGLPVVVNAWGSWCGPCVEEFPLFQRAAVGYGKRVAFVGLNVEDGRDTATTFLRDHWIAYPSYVDPDKTIAAAAGARFGYPTTIFYDRSGQSVFVHQGPYGDEAQLSADIRRYLLRS